MTAAEQQVRAVWQRQNAAMLAGDSAGLDAVLADDYVARHITGYEQPKPEWLAEIREGAFDYHAIDETNLEIRVDGDVATLTSEASVTVTIGGNRGSWPLRSTVRYEQRDGEWLAVRSSSTLA
jgi:ketosteroid isomerase-like protein